MLEFILGLLLFLVNPFISGHVSIFSFNSWQGKPIPLLFLETFQTMFVSVSFQINIRNVVRFFFLTHPLRISIGIWRGVSLF